MTNQRLVRHDYQVSLSSWNADFPDPVNFLAAWRRDAGTTNVVGYANADYDRQLDEAAGLLDPVTRLAKLADAERTLLRDYAILPYGFVNERTLVAERVVGWQENALGIHLSRYLALAP